VDLRRWIVDEHTSLWTRFTDGIVARVPSERWTEHADAGGSCLAQLTFHVSLHADVAMQCVINERPPLVDDWRHDLGLEALAPHRGLSEAEDPDVVAAVRPDALVAYAEAVHRATAQWVRGADLGRLAAVPDASPRLVRHAGVTEDAVPWLHRMWTDQPVAWFVQWECTGHVLNHLGEMVSVRNRMGLSPF
jgi:hypothetical protein